MSWRCASRQSRFPSGLPSTPFSPPPGPAQRLFQRLPAKSKFLAAKPTDLDELHAEAARAAEVTGNGDVVTIVNGSNRVMFREGVAAGAKRIVQELRINQTADAPIFTLLHEKVEAVWRTLREKANRGEAGGVTLEETQRAVAALSLSLDPARARGEERALFEQVQKVARGEASETEIRETLSELAVAEVMRRRKDGSAMSGSIGEALRAAIDAARDPREVTTLGKLRATINALRTYFRAVLGTVAALRHAKTEGKTTDFEALIDKLTGRDEQAAHERYVAAEVEAIAREHELDYKPPTEEEMDAGVAFSIRKASAEEIPRNIQAAAQAGALEFSDWRRFEGMPGKERGELAKRVARDIQQNDGGKIPNASAKHDIDVSVAGLRHWASYSGDVRKLAMLERLRELVARAIYIRSEKPDARKSSDRNLRAYHKFALPVSFDGSDAIAILTVQEDGNGNWVYDARVGDLEIKEPADVLPGPTRSEALRRSDIQQARVKLLEKIFDVKDGRAFRLSAGSRLELMQRRIDESLARDPEARRQVGRRMQEKLDELRLNAETLRVTGKGDEIRPLVEKRTPRELDKEQAFRQAARADELIAEGMSKLTPETLQAVEAGARKLAEQPIAHALLSNPLFPAARSGPTAVSAAARQKQIPSSQGVGSRGEVHQGGRCAAGAREARSRVAFAAGHWPGAQALQSRVALPECRLACPRARAQRIAPAQAGRARAFQAELAAARRRRRARDQSARLCRAGGADDRPDLSGECRREACRPGRPVQHPFYELAADGADRPGRRPGRLAACAQWPREILRDLPAQGSLSRSGAGLPALPRPESQLSSHQKNSPVTNPPTT